MKRFCLLVLVIVLLCLVPSTAFADKPVGTDGAGNEIAWEHSGCTTIQSGTLLAANGLPLATGYDQWGYNYQSHMFNGFYDNFSRPDDLATSGDKLIMKWNDAWLSNVDCSGDSLLDRYYGFQSYKGSGAWLTNHMEGDYTQGDQACHYTYFAKIAAAPGDAVETSGIWYTADGVEIGPSIWGSFAVIEEVNNDPCAGFKGLSYLSRFSPGFGAYAPE